MRGALKPMFGGALCAVALITAAAATPSLPNGAATASTRSAEIIPIDARCGHGWHYVPAGYARHGKWRDAHCSRN